MFKNLLVPFVFTLAVTHTARADTCSSTFCTSPNGLGGYDCWAGSRTEPCTCSAGAAKETGESMQHMGQTYYLYTCCTDGSGTGEQCGTFSGESHPTDPTTECWIDVLTESHNGKDCFEKSCPPLHTKGGEWCKLNPLQSEKVCCGDDCCEPNAGAIAGTVIGVVVGLTLLIVFSCYQGRCGCFRYRRDQLIAATVAARPQQPQVVYVQTAPAKDITSV